MSDSLGTVVMAALKMRDELKAGGLAGPQLDGALEHVLRDTWPKPNDRSEPWHDQCASCRDYGLEMHQCPGDATCGPHPVTGRPRKPHAPHEYGRPCWCPAGKRHQDKPKLGPEDETTVAAKRRPMSKW